MAHQSANIRNGKGKSFTSSFSPAFRRSLWPPHCDQTAGKLSAKSANTSRLQERAAFDYRLEVLLSWVRVRDCYVLQFRGERNVYSTNLHDFIPSGFIAGALGLIRVEFKINNIDVQLHAC